MVRLSRLGELGSKGNATSFCPRCTLYLSFTPIRSLKVGTQMKKANFDVTHELDEFLMVEKPLTHSKRKVNPDFEKMKPEIREMEEQYVATAPHHHSFLSHNSFVGSLSTISIVQNASHTILITCLSLVQHTISKETSSDTYNRKQIHRS